jgi:hypothetical protein
MPAALASGGIMLLTVTEPVPMFAEPTGSPGAVCMMGAAPPCMTPQPAADIANSKVEAIVTVLTTVVAPMGRIVNSRKYSGVLLG